MHALTIGKEDIFYTGIDDCRLTVEKVRQRRLLWHLYHHPNQPKTQPRQKAIKENS